MGVVYRMEVEQFSTKRPTSKLLAAWEQRDTLEVCQGVGTGSAAFVAFSREIQVQQR
jgi:hypothetical protein